MTCLHLPPRLGTQALPQTIQYTLSDMVRLNATLSHPVSKKEASNQCYFPIHAHCHGCSLNKPTNPWHIIIAMLSITAFTLPSPALVADCVQENQMAGDLQFPKMQCSFKCLNKW